MRWREAGSATRRWGSRSRRRVFASALAGILVSINPGPTTPDEADFSDPVAFADFIDSPDFAQNAAGAAAEQWAAWKHAMAEVAFVC